jgi:hypothetical protein
VSKGNADQPTAQVPRGQSSPTRVEVSAEGRQGSPQSPGTPRPQSPTTPGLRDQSGNNGPQDRTPTSAANNAPASKVDGREPASPNGQSKEPRPQPTAGDRPIGSPNPPSVEQKQAPAPQTPQTQQKQAAAPQKQGPSQTPQPKPAPNQPQPRPPTGGQAASATTQAQPPTPPPPTPGTPAARPAAGGIPVWDPPQPLAPRQSIFGRLGFGKKTEQPEVSPAAPPAQQTSAPVTPPAPNLPSGASPSGATASSTQPAPVAGAGPQARTPAPQQQRPAPGSQPGPPTGPGAAVAAGLTAALTTQVGPQARAGQPGTPQGPARPGETTGRTPAVQGGTASPAAPPAGPQARMPAEPTDPAMRAPVGPAPHMTPGGQPLPPPVQAFKDAPTFKDAPAMRNMPVGAHPEAAVPETHHAAKPKVGVARRTRKARLRLSKLDPWSVMKTSFLFSIAAGIMLVAAVYSVWTVLSTSQLFESVNEIVRSVVSTPGDTTPFRIQEYINTQKVMGVTALIACVDVVIFTALATLGSFLYNLAATMLGGLEITLAED